MEWIRVEDRLPDTRGDFLVYDNYTLIAWAFFSSEKRWVSGDEFLNNVTHWMPLPPPPKDSL